MPSWLDQYTQEEIENMPVVIVDLCSEGFRKGWFANYAAAKDALHYPYRFMANSEMMSAMRDKDPEGNPCLRLETAYAYRELGR
jgi:hypothetical protein